MPCEIYINYFAGQSVLIYIRDAPRTRRIFMKKRFFIIISLILATLILFSACVKAPSDEETITDESTTSEDNAPKDALLVNNINVTEYTIVFDGRASIGTDAAQKYFNSKIKQQYNIKLESKTSEVHGYQIFIGVKGSDTSISAFFDSCEDGMIGFDGKNIYILAKENIGLYSVIDAFFAKAAENGDYAEINISQNEKVSVTKDNLKVMSYNVLYDMYYDDSGNLPRDMTALAEFIKSQSPDVFGTQETLDEHKEAILEAMPNYECYTGIKLNLNMTNMIFWNADKYKCVSEGFQYLTDTPFVKSKIPESNSYRGFSYVVLESLATHKQFMLVNVHLTYRNAAGETNDDNARYKQVQYLNKFLEGNKCEGLPVILVGDFNSVPTSSTLKSVENVKRFDRAATVAKTKGDLGGTTTRAEHTIRDTYVFDHIFVTSDRISTEYFSVINADSKVNGRYLSDHLPVIADIVIC